MSSYDHVIRHLHNLEQKVDRIMTAISDYHARVKTAFTMISAGLDGISTDIQTLNDKITQLQNNPGPISDADQALLDEIQGLADNVASRVSALDDQTAPPSPPPSA